jgi:SAM-dependent methyltransferase
MQAYGKGFARVYNLLWTGFAAQVSPLIYDFYLQQAGAEDRRILLDVCCGTGQLASYFLQQDFTVTGLDLSEHMLVYAKENNKSYVEKGQAIFIQGDASNFTLEQRFGLVVSTFDALNHLPDEPALNGCFHSVFQVLMEGGWFIFDLNTCEGLRRWNGCVVDDSNPQAVIINRGLYLPQEKRSWTNITGFFLEENGFYARFDEIAYNTIFKMDWVVQALLDNGFRKAYPARLSDLTQPIETPEKEKRAFFVAQK